MMNLHTIRSSLIVAVLMLGMVGCLKRFNTCDTNVECTEREQEGDTKKPYCVNLRCVQCRNDDDCGNQGFCNKTTNECQKVD